MIDINKIYLIDGIIGMNDIDDNSIDLIICDLPYGITDCKWDKKINLNDLWNQYCRIIKDNRCIILFSQQPFTTELINSNFNWFKEELIWNKGVGANFSIVKYKHLKIHENILIFSKKGYLYNPQKINRQKNVKYQRKQNWLIGNNKFQNLSLTDNNIHILKQKYPNTILEYSKREGESNSTNRIHTTQKPIKLIEYLIKTYSNENDLVLDNCMGSGTTAIASINTNRNYIGFEINKEIYDLSIERISNHNKLQPDSDLIDNFFE